MPKSSNTLLIVLAFFAIYVIWGSTYLLNKIAVGELDPFMLACIRFSTAGVVVLIIAKIMRYNLRISRKQFLNTTFAGFLFLTLGNGLVVWALKYVDSGFAALQISAQPLVVLILLRVLEGKKIKAMSIVGVVLGIVGIFLLVNQDGMLTQEQNLLGIGMIFFCMLSWAYSSIFVSKADLPSNFFINTGYQMLAGGFFLFIFSMILGESWSWPTTWNPEVQVSMILLIVFGSIVAFTSFNYLLRIVSPEKVATSTYVNPIIALFLGWFFLNETVSTQSMIAAGVLLTGVYFITTTKTMLIFSRFSSKISQKSSKK